MHEGWIEPHEIRLQLLEPMHGGPVATKIVEADANAELAQFGDALATAFAGVDQGRARQVQGQAGAGQVMRLELAIENIPTLENPGTGRITAQSIVAALNDLVSPIRIGT